MEPQVAAKLRVLIREVEKKPDSAEAWGKLAMNLDVHDFKNEAKQAYRQAAAADPKDFRWTYYSAIALYETGSPDALALFERSCQLKAKYGPARFRYGQALLDSNRLDEASRQFNLVTPPSSHSSVGLARIALIRGELDQALKYSMEAVQINPKYAEAHGLLSQIYRRRNDLTKANEELRLSQQLPHKSPPDDPLLADLIAEGVSSYWYEWRGRAYLERGHYEAAIRQLKTAVKLLPEARLYDLLGVAFQYTKQYKEAAEQHRLALLKDNSSSTMNNLASALFELTQYEEAVSYLEKAILLEPNFVYSYFHLSLLHLRSGNPAKAIASLRRGHSRLPDNPTLALRLSWLLATVPDASLRNGAEAVQLAEQVCRSNQYRDPESIDILAAAYAETGNFEKSIQLAKEAYQLAISKKNLDFAQRIQSHLKSYQARKPYRE